MDEPHYPGLAASSPLYMVCFSVALSLCSNYSTYTHIHWYRILQVWNDRLKIIDKNERKEKKKKVFTR